MYKQGICQQKTFANKHRLIQRMLPNIWEGNEGEDWQWRGENSQSPRFSSTFEGQRIQPPQLQKLTKPEPAPTTPEPSHSWRQISVSNDVLVSFGKPAPFMHHHASTPHHSPNHFADITPNNQPHHHSPAHQAPPHRLSNKQAQKVKSQSPVKFQFLQRTQHFFAFIAKLTRISQQHLITNKQKAFSCIRQKSRINAEKFLKKLQKTFQTKQRMIFHAIHCQSIQKLLLHQKQNEVQSSDGKIFTKEETKIDMLAECNIETEFSEGGQIMTHSNKEFEKASKVRSQVQQNQEQKRKMFHFNNQIKRKNMDPFDSYGLGDDVRWKRKRKEKKNDGQIKILSQDTKSESTPPSQKTKSQTEVQEHHRGSLSVEQSMIGLRQISISHMEARKELYHLQCDTFKQSYPDVCQTPPEPIQLVKVSEKKIKIHWEKIEEQASQLNETYDHKNEKKGFNCSPLIKNVESLIEKKLLSEKSEHCSQESVKVSESGKQLERKLKSPQKITPIQQYQTHDKTVKPQRPMSQNPQQLFRKEVIGFPKYQEEKTLKNRPISFMVGNKQKMIDYRLPRDNYIQSRIQQKQEYCFKQRANSGTPIHMTPSPAKSSTSRKSTFVGKPKVFFTASSPEKKQMQQRANGREVKLQPHYHYYQTSPKNKNSPTVEYGRGMVYFPATQPQSPTVLSHVRRVSNVQSPRPEPIRQPLTPQPEYYSFVPISHTPKSSAQNQAKSDQIRSSRSTSTKKIQIVSHR